MLHISRVPIRTDILLAFIAVTYYLYILLFGLCTRGSTTVTLNTLRCNCRRRASAFADMRRDAAKCGRVYCLVWPNEIERRCTTLRWWEQQCKPAVWSVAVALCPMKRDRLNYLVKCSFALKCSSALNTLLMINIKQQTVLCNVHTWVRTTSKKRKFSICT